MLVTRISTGANPACIVDSFVSQVSPETVVNRSAYLLFYRRRSDGPLGPPHLQQMIEDGHDQHSASSSSPERLHDDLQNPRLQAPFVGQTDGMKDPSEQPPDYGSQEMDEGISMDYNADEPLQTMEDNTAQQRFIGPVRPDEWSFSKLDGTHAPPGSDAGNNSDDTLNGTASDKPALGSEDGGDARMQEDFADEPTRQAFSMGGQMAHMPPTPGEEDESLQNPMASIVSHSHLDQEYNEDDGEATEIRLSPQSDEEGA